MEKLVKLTLSPFSPSIEVVDKMVMKVHVPYSEQSVTIQFNPNIQDYKEQADQRVCDKNMGRFDNSFYLAYNLNAC